MDRPGRLCIFCGSRPGARASYARAAVELGRLLAREGIGVVYGGASIGIMGAVADAALAAGGEVIGVIPRVFIDLEVAHQGLTTLHVVDTMHDRKALMADLSDGFLVLPGGIGTLEEMFEAWTWGQIGYHRKPCAVLDVDGFWSGLIGVIDHLVAEAFLRPDYREMLIVENDPDALLAAVLAYEPHAVPKLERPPEPRQR